MYQISLRSRNTYDHWRVLAEYWHISSEAKQRLEWLIFYYSVGKRNVSFTASYFCISRKTFHKWLKRFNPHFIQSLEEKSRAPHQVRQWQVIKKQEERIIELRKKHLKHGKKKLKRLYFKQYREIISTWKVERVIRKHQLYPDPEECQKNIKKQKRRAKKAKIRINKLKEFGFNPQPGKLWHIDTIILWRYGQTNLLIRWRH